MKNKPYFRTKVNYMKSVADIKKMLQHHNIHTIEHRDGFDPVDNTYKTMMGFALLDKIDDKFHETPIAYVITLDHKPDDRKKYDQEMNSIYRVLFHHIKALFVGIEYGLVDLKEAFMPNMMVKGYDGQLVTLYRRWLPSYTFRKALLKGDLSTENLLPELGPVPEDKTEVINIE